MQPVGQPKSAGKVKKKCTPVNLSHIGKFDHVTYHVNKKIRPPKTKQKAYCKHVFK